MGRLRRWGQTVARHSFGAGAFGARAFGAGAGRRRPAEPPCRLFLGLRDFGPWWAELYRIPGEPVSYFVQLLAAHGCRPEFTAARLELGNHTAVALATGGARLSASVPEGVSASGGLRLVAEQRDGTVLTAFWE